MFKETQDIKEAVHVFGVCSHFPNLTDSVQGPIICLEVSVLERKMDLICLLGFFVLFSIVIVFFMWPLTESQRVSMRSFFIFS